MSEGKGRWTILYAGMVQGVGFRQTAAHCARRFPVTGYVRNLPNGQVELVVEGESEGALGLLRAVAEAMKGNIEQSTMTESAATGEWDAFAIRR